MHWQAWVRDQSKRAGINNAINISEFFFYISPLHRPTWRQNSFWLETKEIKKNKNNPKASQYCMARVRATLLYEIAGKKQKKTDKSLLFFHSLGFFSEAQRSASCGFSIPWADPTVPYMQDPKTLRKCVR